MAFKKIVHALVILMWPVSLFLANTHFDYLKYVLPAAILFLSYFFYERKGSFFLAPLIAIPIIEPKLALFPFFFVLVNAFIEQNFKSHIVPLLTSILVLVFVWNSFSGQTIFTRDYEAQQAVIRKTQLYDSIFLARLFHNKARIIFDKFTNNFFALTDPGNYFFGFHPRESIDNQNLQKYPFLSLPILIYGIYKLRVFKNYEAPLADASGIFSAGFVGAKSAEAENSSHSSPSLRSRFSAKADKFVASAIVAGILGLSFLAIYDRNDFVLWFPITLILLHGVNLLDTNKGVIKIYFALITIFSVPEIVRLFL